MMHVWFIGLREHFGELAGKHSFSPFLIFLFSQNSRERFGRAKHPGPPSLSRHVGFNGGVVIPVK